MDSSMLYRPAGKWQVWAAFCGAVLVHIGAVVLADRSSAAAAADATEVPPDVIIVPIIDDPQPVDPIDPPRDLAPPPPPAIDSLFIEEQPLPPPVRQRLDRRSHVPVQAAAAAPRMTMTSAKVLAINAPRPEYPYEARRVRAIGSGVAVLTVDPATGHVTDVRMARSIGNVVLDNAAISGFRRWRFKPGTVSIVHTPITYTLTGASF